MNFDVERYILIFKDILQYFILLRFSCFNLLGTELNCCYCFSELRAVLANAQNLGWKKNNETPTYSLFSFTKNLPHICQVWFDFYKIGVESIEKHKWIFTFYPICFSCALFYFFFCFLWQNIEFWEYSFFSSSSW